MRTPRGAGQGGRRHIRHLTLLPFARIRTLWSWPSDETPGSYSPSPAPQRGSVAPSSRKHRARPRLAGKPRQTPAHRPEGAAENAPRRARGAWRPGAVFCSGPGEGREASSPKHKNVWAAPDPVVQAPGAHCLTLGGALSPVLCTFGDCVGLCAYGARDAGCAANAGSTPHRPQPAGGAEDQTLGALTQAPDRRTQAQSHK